MTFFTLENKKILITGGSKGIGNATAEMCLELGLGAHVTIVGRDTNAINKAIIGWKNKNYHCYGITGDLSKKDDIKTIINEYKQINGDTLDCLINTVGYVIAKPTIDFNEDDFNTVVNNNIRSAFFLCQQVFPLLKLSPEGAIVNISSENALKATPGKVLEGVSRAAIVHMTKSLAVEWAKYNIRVNSVAPGLTATERVKKLDKELVESAIQNIPLHRMATPNELASAITFLCMPAANSITGQCLIVDGGKNLV